MNFSSIKHTNTFRPYSALRFTSTGRDRNTCTLNHLFEEYKRQCTTHQDKVRILEIGPGVCTRNLGSNRRTHRALDKLLRRLPLPYQVFESYETMQIRTIAQQYRLIPEITVVDQSRKVLRIVKAGNEFEDVRYLQRDICEDARLIGSGFDLVICLNVLMHLRHRSADEANQGRENVLRLCRANGLIAASPKRIFDGHPAVDKLNDVLYRKKAYFHMPSSISQPYFPVKQSVRQRDGRTPAFGKLQLPA